MYELQQIQLAAYVSVAAHSAVGQRRKYTGEPYWMHTHAVAKRVEAAGGTPQQICAAYLHDTVEDTQLTLDDIKGMFGPEVGALVAGLTDVSKPADGTRIIRRTIDRLHTAKQAPEVKLIKLCDILDNLESIVEHDPVFGQTYWVEASLLFPHLRIDNKLYNTVGVYLESTKDKLALCTLYNNVKVDALMRRHLDAERELGDHDKS
jgi:(p)ppGpp synthase/HD superfamily hydrolase